MSKSKKRQSTARVLAAAIVATLALVIGAGAAFADAPSPSDGVQVSTRSVSGGTEVTISGTWEWPTHKSDCNTNRFAAGWAVDWHDSTQPGNLVGTLNGSPILVGTPSDNQVHYKATPPRCGTFNGSFNTGTWGPISHVYPPSQTDFNFCVVMYDLHGKPGDAAPKDPIAGGKGHNGDNSVQANKKTPAGNGCTMHHTDVPNGTVGLLGLAGLTGAGFVGYQVRRRRKLAAVTA